AALAARAVSLLQDEQLRAGSEEAHWIAYTLAEHERDAEARSLSDRAPAEARVVGDVWSLCFGLYARAAIEHVIGRVDLASAYAGDGLALAVEIGESWRISEAYAVIVEVEAARSSPEACQRLLDERALLAPFIEPNLRGFYFGLPLGRAWLACGGFETAGGHRPRASPQGGRGRSAAGD